MNRAEIKKLLKKAEPGQLDEIILAMISRFPAGQKELAELTIQAVLAGKEPPAKTAVIPDIKKIHKFIQTFEFRIETFYYYSHRKARIQWRRQFKEYWNALKSCPPESTVHDAACEMMIRMFDTLYSAVRRGLLFEDNVFSNMRLNAEDMVQTILTCTLASGFTHNNLLTCLKLVVEPNIFDLRFLNWMQILFCSRIKNGDLRLEILEMLKDMDKAGLSDSESSLACRLLYLRLAREEMGEKAAVNDLASFAGNRAARDTLETFNDLKKTA